MYIYVSSWPTNLFGEGKLMMGRITFLGGGLLVLLMAACLCQTGFTEEKYTVKPGDSLCKISKSFGVSSESLKRTNHIKGDTIRPRQILLIPLRNQKATGELVQKTPPLLQSTMLKTEPVPGPQKPEIRTEEEEEPEEGLMEESVLVAYPEMEKKEPPASPGKWSGEEERGLFLRVVKTFLGVPYRLGGSTLRGIDCSALVKRIYEIFNISLPRTAREQLQSGKRVGMDELEEGDLVFFNTRRVNNAHVGIYIGNGEFVHASSSNRQVKVDHLSTPYFNKRFLGGVRVKEWERDS